jgi:hypothetical protein
MNQTVSTFRAITAVFFQRIFRPVIWVGTMVIIGLYIVTIYLGVAIHGLWWLLLIVLIPGTVLLGGMAAALWFLANRLLPRPLQSHERRQLLGFADKIIRIAEVRATPIPVLVFLVAKDVIRGRRSTYVEEVVEDSKSLKDDYIAARTLFETKTLS